MQDRLNAVLEKHCETIKGSVAALGRQLSDIAEGAASDPLSAVQSAEAVAHQLKGSTGTAGFHDVSRAATALDDHLKILCRSDEDCVAGGMDEAMGLYAVLEKVSVELSPACSSLYAAV